MAVHTPSPDKPRVGFFATCLVDLFRPNVGFAAIKLLEDAGCEVSVPELQTCCGQPAYNSGDMTDSRELAKNVITSFEEFDYVVVPSGSCAGMLHEHYPRLFDADSVWRARAQHLSERCHEILSFLTSVLKIEDVGARLATKVTYHDSCSGLRELGIQEQPRRMLQHVAELELCEMQDSNVCCGFGGTFCVKYPRISERMVSDKLENIESTGANYVLGGDLGCLMNIAGRLKRTGSDVEAYHVVEVLAGMLNAPPIGTGSR